MGLLSVLEQDLENKSIEKDTKGLSSYKAQELLKRNGKNELKNNKKIHPLKVFVNQYKDILIMILLVSTVISIFLGEYVEAIAIAVIVLLNGIMGFIQEYKTEKTLESLKKMSAPTARVYRDGKLINISADMVVVGDVVDFKSGDRVCADCIVTQSNSMMSDESILTGESMEVQKQVCTKKDDKNYTLNRKDMVYMGTVITKGHGEGIVVNTAMQTQMGQIANLLSNIDNEQTQLQRKLQQLGKYIAIGCLLICAVVSVTGILRGENILDMLLMGISLAVSAVPEGLPAIVTISLALAVGRMVKQKSLVRKLHAVETLGCTNVICSDKTGTLTQNKMTVTKIMTIDNEINIENDKKALQNKIDTHLVKCAVLCNNADEKNKNFSQATELALVNMVKKLKVNITDIKRENKRMYENPFDSKTKYMTVVTKDVTNMEYMYVKGAVDVILDKCKYVKTSENETLMSSVYKEKILKNNEIMANNALRVIALAYKKLDSKNYKNEDNLVFLGLVGIIDPPRKEAIEAIKLCKLAGIKTVMITGDHKLTACAIAKQIGIYSAGDLVLEGKEIENMTEERLNNIVNKVTVFARVSPTHKLRIVKAFKLNQNIVAMTGDGVNDAPAIKTADIGVSMGSGTDVTKEASDIILLDDNFATLTNAVKEGRVIYSNIRKFIRYLLSCNIGEVVTIFLSMIMGMPMILLPIQILLINLVTDGLPAIALGLEKGENNIMKKMPRHKNESIFSNGLLTKIIFRGIFIGLSTLASFVTVYKMTNDITTARTSAYFTLITTQLINVFECKSEEKTIFTINIFNNVKLLFASLCSVLILLLTIYIKPLQFIFNTVSLNREIIFVSLSFCIIPTITSLILISNNKNRGKDKK